MPLPLPQHLVQWDAGNPECLLQLVKELIQQYHHYQYQRLRDSSRLLFEYESLLEDPNYGRNMEIYAGRKNSWVSNCLMTLLIQLQNQEPWDGITKSLKWILHPANIRHVIPKAWLAFS